MRDWIEHRREDGERVGWIRPEGEDFVVIDILGREDPTPRDWLAAEETLEERGLRWLAEPWELELDDGYPVPVRIVSVSPDAVTVQSEDYGAVDVEVTVYRLPFPAPSKLRPRTAQATPYLS
ncbi:hypothetical protein GCM10023169_25350 [Georgenia halophila]|uniref:Uncharacterized protein n=1 Tax=Georgenia halophila TaxID=620889 RepID=A0ABP8LBG0_9MICO